VISLGHLRCSDLVAVGCICVDRCGGGSDQLPVTGGVERHVVVDTERGVGVPILRLARRNVSRMEIAAAQPRMAVLLVAERARCIVPLLVAEGMTGISLEAEFTKIMRDLPWGRGRRRWDGWAGLCRCGRGGGDR